MSAGKTILAVNLGSSSVKVGLYRAGEPPSLLVDNQGRGDLAAALDALGGFPSPHVIGHRCVHGGPGVRDHCQLDAAVLSALEAAVAYAPLHLPAALAAMAETRRRWPAALQVACLDTAFHRDMPELARRFALPAGLGVERFGFHGLALESVVAQLTPLPSRVVAAHLGSGASITAIAEGRSVDTSMGLTPTGGIMMATRSGDLDPGAIVYLLRHRVADASALEELVDRHAGMLAVSESSGDVRELLARGAADPRAALALEMFAYQAAKGIAAMAAAMGGADLIAFSGGIGENAGPVRERIMRRLEFLHAPARVIRAQEDQRIAEIAQRLAVGL